MDYIKLAAQTANKLAKTRIQDGKVPKFLGVPGLLALMHENMVRYHEEDQEWELADFAAHAIIALSIKLEESGVGKSDVSDETETSDDPDVIDDVEEENLIEDVD